MATIVVQLGLATMLRGISSSAWALTSGTTSGTCGSMRQADELSTTTAPASATRGARTLEVAPPAENRTMSSPDQSAVSASSTSTSPSPHFRRRPAERLDANRRNSLTGNWRSARTVRMTPPTWPGAPMSPILMGDEASGATVA